MTNHNDNGELSYRIVKLLKDRRNWSSDQFFVHLSQLATNHHRAIPRHSLQFPKSFADAVRSLEKHDGATNGLGTPEPFCTGF